MRVFQDFATVDLIPQGRAAIAVGCRSFIESYPLFGFDLNDYDSLFAENLALLLNIRENTYFHWSGKHRASLTGQGMFPRLVQNPLPVWIGIGGTPKPFARAGALGVPPPIEMSREAGRRADTRPSKSAWVSIRPVFSPAALPRPPPISIQPTPTPSPRSEKSADGRP